MLQPPRLVGPIIRTVSWIYKPQSGVESMPLRQAPAERVLSVTLNWTSFSSRGSLRPAEHAGMAAVSLPRSAGKASSKKQTAKTSVNS